MVFALCPPDANSTLLCLTNVKDDKKACPNCGHPQMGTIGEGDLRVCAECKTLVWEENGKTEWRVPVKLTPEEVATLDREADESARPKS
jgi:RNA polymerase subunit RPABC4/transcription elongation factor Spt4